MNGELLMSGTMTMTNKAIKPQAKEVWIVKFPYEENDGRFKKRPVIVLSEINDSEVEVAEVSEESYLGVKVTSKEERGYDDGDTVIIKWKEANLKKPSVARVSKAINIPISQFIRKIGETDDADFMNILQIFFEISGL
jgi:PemK-like, MazF-like toxin of type II toxin-antitoxin system